LIILDVGNRWINSQLVEFYANCQLDISSKKCLIELMIFKKFAKLLKKNQKIEIGLILNSQLKIL